MASRTQPMLPKLDRGVRKLRLKRRHDGPLILGGRGRVERRHLEIGRSDNGRRIAEHSSQVILQPCRPVKLVSSNVGSACKRFIRHCRDNFFEREKAGSRSSLLIQGAIAVDPGARSSLLLLVQLELF